MHTLGVGGNTLGNVVGGCKLIGTIFGQIRSCLIHFCHLLGDILTRSTTFKFNVTLPVEYFMSLEPYHGLNN